MNTSKKQIVLVALALASKSLLADFSATVGTVAELTNAIARATASSETPKIITLKPGVYDLSTLEEHVVTKAGTTTLLWGTACAPDKFGISSLVYNSAISFRGQNTKHWSQKSPSEESIVRGNGKIRVFYGYTGVGRGSTYYHLTIENGDAGDADGGGIYSMGTASNNGMLTNCVIRNNKAMNGGGTCAISAIDCLYENNQADVGGGAYGKSDSTRTNRFKGCVFRNNMATGLGGGGLGIELNAQIDGCVFSNNVASAADGQCGGGGVRVEDGIKTLAGCTFKANSSNGDAGGLWIKDKITTMQDCVFESNYAKGDYAAFSADSYDLVRRSTFKNNVARGLYAGVAVSNFVNSGSIENCLFDNNTNKFTNAGSQIHYAKKVTGCTFTGYGDMFAKQYDGCVFGGCSFTFSNYGGGMLVFDNDMGDVHLRNCLFTNNTVNACVRNSSGRVLDIANCTFVGNSAIQVRNVGNKSKVEMSDGYLFSAWRGGKASDGSGNACPSTNEVVNCVFKDNKRHGKRNDVTFYTTKTSVSEPSGNILRTSIYQTVVADTHFEAAIKSDNIVDDPKLVAGGISYPGAPFCMIRPNSPARGKGAVLDWMTGETDILGNPMFVDGKTDIGCYQCTLRAPGLILIVQ